VRCGRNGVEAIIFSQTLRNVRIDVFRAPPHRWNSPMAEFFPIRSSSPREPDRRPRPIPPKIKAVVHNLIWGRDDDPDALPMDLIAACIAAGVAPFVARRYLDRPGVIAHLRAELRKRRAIDCCGNPAALRRVRDTSQNAMAVVAAVRAMDGLQAEDAGRADGVTPGVTIRIVNVAPQPTPSIDVTPNAEPSEPFVPGWRAET
jgi:hypothetical protein